MRILVLTNKMPFPPKDGGSIATLNMLIGLQKAGNQVSCLALNTSKHYFPEEDIPEEYSSRITLFTARCDTRIKPMSMAANLLFSSRPYIAKRFDNREFQNKLAKLLDTESFDLIQMEGPYLAQYLGLIRKKSSALLSFRAHNIEHLIWYRKASHERNPLIRAYLKNLAHRICKLETALAREMDCILPISAVDAEYFKKKCPSKAIKVVPAGLQTEDYSLQDLPGESSCFFIGALDWMPNQEGLRWFLKEVFPGLREKFPELLFHVAGRNAPPAIERILKQKGIVYYGEVENAKAFIKDQSIMIAPLFTGSGIRIKILEAMALGKPVLTTPIGIEGIPARNGEEVCVATEAIAFRNTLENLLRDEGLRQKLRQKGRKLVQENFDTFEISKQVTSFFKKLR